MTWSHLFLVCLQSPNELVSVKDMSIIILNCLGVCLWVTKLRKTFNKKWLKGTPNWKGMACTIDRTGMKNTHGSFSVDLRCSLSKVDEWRSWKHGRECYHFLGSVSLVSWTRPTCLAPVSIVSWANRFRLFAIKGKPTCFCALMFSYSKHKQ